VFLNKIEVNRLTKKHIASSLLITVFALIGIVGGVSSLRQPQEIRKTAAPATTIYFDPSTVNTSVGQTVSFDIKLDTGSNYASYLQLDINYDSTILQATLLDFDDAVLPVNLDPVDLSQPGIITGSAGILPGGNPIHGTGVKVALVSFNVIGNAPSGTSINFGDNTLAYTGDPGETPTGVNLITSKISAVVTIPAPPPPPSPTLPPTPTSTPRPTNTPTPKPSPTSPPIPSPTIPPIQKGTLSGTVYDAVTQGPIGGATINITIPGLKGKAGRVAKLNTNSSGYFVINLNPNTYSINASAKKYQKDSQSVILQAGQTSNLNFALNPKGKKKGLAGLVETVTETVSGFFANLLELF
jgi:hypothetical protein